MELKAKFELTGQSLRLQILYKIVSQCSACKNKHRDDETEVCIKNVHIMQRDLTADS